MSVGLTMGLSSSLVHRCGRSVRSLDVLGDVCVQRKNTYVFPPSTEELLVKSEGILPLVMEQVAVDNLIDFELPSEATVFSTGPASSMGGQQQPSLPEPMAPAESGSHPHQDEAENDSDATESADSDNDMDPPSHTWDLRRSSSSSAHSGEDADADTVERRQFMNTYVEKVFHGK